MKQGYDLRMKYNKKEKVLVTDEDHAESVTTWKCEKEKEEKDQKGTNKAQTTEDFRSRILPRARSSDYTSLQGLSTQTGCNKENLDLLVLKELVDNALDSCTKNPVIDIGFRKRANQFLTLTVEDNGKGIKEEDLETIFDFDSFSSTKFYYKLPTRGALGNAFKCIVGLPYAVSSELHIAVPQPLVSIHSTNRKHSISLDVDRAKQSLECRIQSCKYGKRNGTKISVNIPRLEEDWGIKKQYLDMIISYAVFNPNSIFRFIDMSKESKKLEFSSVSKKSRGFDGDSSVHWYTFAQFEQLVEALLRSIQAGEKDITLTQFIKHFKGLTSDDKVTLILNELADQNLKYISELADKENIIKRLFEQMMKYSTDPSPNVLGKIGKKEIFDRIQVMYGPIAKQKYKISSGVFHEGEPSIPFVLEVALAVLQGNCGLQLHTGINHSPCLKNPFEGYTIAWGDDLGKEHKADILHGLLKQYEIDDDQPVVIVIHLVCPNIEYESYGKGKVNIKPFVKALGQTLTGVCRFYPGFKRRKGLSKGKTSKARTLLLEELCRRQNLLEKFGQMPPTERITQQGIYYKVRSQMGGEIDIKRDSFTPALREACKEMGGGDLSFREKLGITAAERAQLYFRGQVSPISWDRIEDLATKGSDVVLIEKEGVCEVLEPYAARRGIALLNSRGFATDYAKQLLELSQKWKGNIFLLTDFDASGLLIASKVLGGQIPRIGVDLKMIEKLELSRRDLEEKYDTKDSKAPTKHLMGLPEEMQAEVKDTRVEIDAVLAAVGPEKFWNYIEQTILEMAPTRNMNRSVDLTIQLPSEVAESINAITGFIQSAGSEKRNELRQKLHDWKEGFVNVDDKEKELQSQIAEEIRENNSVQELARQLKSLSEKIPKSS
jgi:DNA topoisomerase VI subunit B